VELLCEQQPAEPDYDRYRRPELEGGGCVTYLVRSSVTTHTHTEVAQWRKASTK
jgi:hypothetical protein